jgi:hypothetical protein
MCIRRFAIWKMNVIFKKKIMQVEAAITAAVNMDVQKQSEDIEAARKYYTIRAGVLELSTFIFFPLSLTHSSIIQLNYALFAYTFRYAPKTGNFRFTEKQNRRRKLRKEEEGVKLMK